jgi:glycine C-acetyltransferase
MVMVDDSHAVGFMGRYGRGTHEHHDVMDRVDIITGTLGKAMGGASGGFTAARGNVIDWLRQRSRPYLFSNSLAPGIVAASLRVLDLLRDGDALREQLRENSSYFRQRMQHAGFTLAGAEHPIIPIMIGDASLAAAFADALLAEGIYVVGFSFPVVPKGQARIRTQMSAAHSKQQLDAAIDAFTRVGQSLGIV